MRTKTLTLTSGLAAALSLAVSWSVTVAGQGAPPRPAAAKSADTPRTADGHPDLTGVYDIATLTPLDRPAMFGDKGAITPEEAKRLEKQVADRIDARGAAERRQPRGAADWRRRLEPARPATSAATTTSGSIRARST